MATTDDNPNDPAKNYLKSLQNEILAAKERELVLVQQKQSLIEEFTSAVDKADDSGAAVAKRAFATAAASAVARIIYLAENAESESLQFNASKFVIGAGLGDSVSVTGTDDSEFMKLLESFKPKPRPEKTTSGTSGTSSAPGVQNANCTASEVIADIQKENS